MYAMVAAMIAPALFLTATSSLMISTATRIARIVNRIRILVAMCDRSRRGDDVLDCLEARRKHALDELRRLQSRSDRVMVAVTLLYMASAGPDHRLPTDPASRHAEPGRDRDDTLDRSNQRTSVGMYRRRDYTVRVGSRRCAHRRIHRLQPAEVCRH
jgi:Protein of unknown function (DUF2721)